MTETETLLARIGTAHDAISRKTEQTSLDYMIDGVLMNCSVLLKEQEEEIENLKQTAQSMMEGIVISTSMFYPCESCQEFNCDFCKFKRTRS